MDSFKILWESSNRLWLKLIQKKNIFSLKQSWSQCFLCQDVKSLVENSYLIVKSGLIFVDQAKVINDLPTKINQDIKFVDMQTWKVYEHYKINKRTIKNQLGFFNSAFQYVHSVQKLRVISNKPPSTFDSCLSINVIYSYIKNIK